MRAARITKIALMTALTVAGAYIIIPIPNLPFTLQTLSALLAGLILKRKDALIAELLYVALGLIGLPVFAAGGAGITYVLRPSFGYVLCLPLIAWFASAFKEKNLYAATFIPLILNLLIGGVWLIIVTKMYTTINVWKIVWAVFLLYVPVEIVKGIIGIIVYKRLKNLVVDRG